MKITFTTTLMATSFLALSAQTTDFTSAEALGFDTPTSQNTFTRLIEANQADTPETAAYNAAKATRADKRKRNALKGEQASEEQEREDIEREEQTKKALTAIETLKASVGSTDEKLAAAQAKLAQIPALEEKILHLTNEKKVLESALSEQDNNIQDIRETLQREAETHKENTSKLQGDLAASQKAVTEYNERSKALQANLDKELAKKDKLSKRIQESQMELSQLSAALGTVEGEKERLTKQVQTLAKQHAALVDQLSTVTTIPTPEATTPLRVKKGRGMGTKN